MADLICSVSLVEDKSAFGNSKSSLYVEDIYDVIEKVFKIDPVFELGVCQRGRGFAKYWNVGVRNEHVWNKLQMNKHLGEQYSLPSGTIVQIGNAFETFQDITVKHIPPHWSREQVQRIFGFYGKIVDVKQEAMKFSVRSCKSSYEKVWNGNWRIRMTVTREIPSSLIISGWQIEIFYRSQIRTCYRCGQSGHEAYNCKTRYNQFENRFSLEEYPELVPKPPIVIEESNEEENEDRTQHPQINRHTEGTEYNRGPLPSGQSHPQENSGVEVPAQEVRQEKKISGEETSASKDVRQVKENRKEEPLAPKEKQQDGDNVSMSSEMRSWAKEVEGGAEEMKNLNEMNETVMQELNKMNETDMQDSDIPIVTQKEDTDENMEKISEAPIEVEKVKENNEQVKEIIISEEANRKEEPELEDFRQLTIVAEVSHRDCSQVVRNDRNLEKKEKSDPEYTESASEGEEMEVSEDSRPTPGQRVTEKDIENSTKEQVVDLQLASSSLQVGSPAILSGSMKRDSKALQSSAEEDTEGTIRFGIGSVVNSFWNKARKKKKDDSD